MLGVAGSDFDCGVYTTAYTSVTPNSHRPRAQTLVVIRTFSFPSRNLWMMEARCSTVSSPLSKDTWWPSCIISTVSHLALRRV